MFLTPPLYYGYPVSQLDFNHTNIRTQKLSNQTQTQMQPQYTKCKSTGTRNSNSNSNNMPVLGTIMQVKHSRDGVPYTKIQYNNFYKDWKKDAIHNTSYQINAPIPTSKVSSNSIPIQCILPKKPYEYYDKPDVIPLAINGINNINILFNDNCINNTFNYKHFTENKYQSQEQEQAQSQDTNNTNNINSTNVYNSDISLDTQHLHKHYLNNAIQNNLNLYKAVYEDMCIMSLEHNDI